MVGLRIVGGLCVAAVLAGCQTVTSAGGGAATPIGGGDGPTFVTDENGCRYELILGERYPIVDERGRPQCSSL